MKRVFALIMVIVCMAACCACGTSKNSAKVNDTPKKHITIKVIDSESKETTFETDTNSEMLRGVLDELKLVEGEESQYGLFIQSVNGITANTENEEWWCITKGGEVVTTGVDSTPVADGDTFELTLKIGYDF